MVVFTCNHCGDSLQKPKVEKHYDFTTCKRNPKSLTCVDCLKDFRLEEYASHTKCVTEVERYAAKGTVIAVSKGEKRQDAWIDTVKSIIAQEKHSASPSVMKIFNIIENSTNLPRKKKPFTNFLKSSTGFKLYDTDIDVVWNIIENHINIQQKANKASDVPEENNANDRYENKEDKKKKKKSKHTTNEENGTSEVPNEVAINENEDVVNESTTDENKEGKKKKKKKSKQTANEENIVTETSEIPKENEDIKIDETNTSENKEGKKKKKSKQTTDLQNGVNEMNDLQKESEINGKSFENDVIPHESKSESKKSKKKRKAKSGVEELEVVPEKKIKTGETENNVETPMEDSEKSSKKNKKRKSQQAEINGNQYNNDHNIQKSPIKKEENGTSQSKTAFSWINTIEEILKKYPEGIDKDKLQNKVIKKYGKSLEAVDNNKSLLTKKYYQKLRKLNKIITTENNIIKLQT